MVAKDQYEVDDAGKARVQRVLWSWCASSRASGNAGTVEKIIDNATQKQTDRLLSMTTAVKGSHDTSTLSRNDLMKLTAEELVTPTMMEQAKNGVDALANAPLMQTPEKKSQFPYGVGGTQGR